MATLSVSETATAVVSYFGGDITATANLPGATAESPTGESGCRYVAFFNGFYWTFQSNGIWRSPDGVTWTFVLAPSGLTATNSARAGFFVLNLQGLSNLCAAYNTSGSTWVLMRSSNGVDWITGPPISLSTGDVGKAAVFNNQVYCFNGTGTTLYLRRFDFLNLLPYETAIAGSVAAVTANIVVVSNSGVLSDGPYAVVYTTAALSGLLLIKINIDSNTSTLLITPSSSTSLDSTAIAGAYYSEFNDTIWCLIKRSSTGLGAYSTDSSFTSWVDRITIVNSSEQTNTAITKIRVVTDPHFGATPLWHLRINSSNEIQVFVLNETSYSTAFYPIYGVGANSSASDYFAEINGSYGSITPYASDFVYKPGLSGEIQIEYVESTVTNNGTEFTVSLNLNGIFQDPRLAIYYADAYETATADIPATISYSTEPVDGNSISLANFSPGASVLTFAIPDLPANNVVGLTTAYNTTKSTGQYAINVGAAWRF